MTTTTTTTHPQSTTKPNRHPRKFRPVPVAHMRTPLHTQRKYKRAQAEEYAAHFDLDKFGVPVINHRDGVFWILDGQHRIGALRLWFGSTDPGVVECEVYENLTDAEAAEIFLGRDTRRAVSVFEKFHVACTAERPRECDIRRTVESQGLKVSQSKDSKCVGAVSALYAVYDKAGATVLGQTLRTLRDAHGGDSQAFDNGYIQGLGLVFNRFNGKTQEKHLVERLSNVQHGARGVLQRAEAMRERTGSQKVHCIASAIVEIYNKGIKHASQRLPSWWKSSDERCES